MKVVDVTSALTHPSIPAVNSKQSSKEQAINPQVVNYSAASVLDDIKTLTTSLDIIESHRSQAPTNSTKQIIYLELFKNFPEAFYTNKANKRVFSIDLYRQKTSRPLIRDLQRELNSLGNLEIAKEYSSSKALDKYKSFTEIKKEAERLFSELTFSCTILENSKEDFAINVEALLKDHFAFLTLLKDIKQFKADLANNAPLILQRNHELSLQLTKARRESVLSQARDKELRHTQVKLLLLIKKSAELKKEITEKQRHLAHLQTENANIEADYQAEITKLQELQQRFQNLQKKFDTQTESTDISLGALKNKLEKQLQENEQLTQKVLELEAELTKANQSRASLTNDHTIALEAQHIKNTELAIENATSAIDILNLKSQNQSLAQKATEGEQAQKKLSIAEGVVSSLQQTNNRLTKERDSFQQKLIDKQDEVTKTSRSNKQAWGLSMFSAALLSLESLWLILVGTPKAAAPASLDTSTLSDPSSFNPTTEQENFVASAA